MIAAAALAGSCLLILATWLAWTVRVLQVGTLDALALAEKIGTPRPVSALDWPELKVRAVVSQDIPGEPSLVVVRVEWPAHREQSATLLLDLGCGDQPSLPLLTQWCATQASISPTRCADGELQLRRRQSLDRIQAVLIAEDRVAPV